MNPKPEIFMFSSEAARKAYERRARCPFLYSLIDVICEVVKLIVRIILFIPIGLFWVLGKICQNVLLPAAGGAFSGQLCFVKRLLQEAFHIRVSSWVDSGYASSVESIPIQNDDLFIDALRIEFPNARKDRWMLISLGNSECFENRAILRQCDDWILNIAKQSQANVLVFNYPGVMHSTGPISRESLGKSYRACVRYLRDHPKGPKAKQIIAYGYSLGTLIQALGLSKETTDGSDGINWFVIKDRGPKSVSAVAFQWVGKLGQWATKLLGWEIDSAKFSESLVCPELFIHGMDCQSQLIGDGLFNRNNCFAAPFLDSNSPNLPGKKISVGEYLLLHQGVLQEATVQKIVEHITNHFDPGDPNETSDSGE
ncbi:CPn0927/CPn0928 family alpha/beta hydrolase fold protein [Chlamydia poikilotherma]|nr:CPn0927/CPn0928 family alpha/beta hydrolase fold protein [Chlamydia poikilotherma]